MVRLAVVLVPSPAVIELAWFAAGVAATAVVALMWRLANGTAHPRRRAPARRPATTQRLTLPFEPARGALDARCVATAVAEDLANLVSGVEGSAHHLIQSAPDRRQLPGAAESMLAAIARLRMLHTKVLAYGQARASAPGSTHIGEIVASLRDDLQQMQLGLELRWEPRSALPAVLVAPDVVRDALLFLCGALLRAERGATHLSIDAERCYARSEPRVQIELALEWVTEPRTPPANDVQVTPFLLDLEAASSLITTHGGEVALSHLPGRTVRAVVRWPATLTAADRTEAREEPRERTPAVSHRYGGALLLEADPAIRAMLASELKATGRAVFACADIAAARSFLEATPDRFEVLIVDHPQRLDADATLLPTIRDRVPALKICVLGQANATTGNAWPALHCIQKPFGVHELRRALASVLADG